MGGEGSIEVASKQCLRQPPATSRQRQERQSLREGDLSVVVTASIGRKPFFHENPCPSGLK
jgi:hypothetical protein